MLCAEDLRTHLYSHKNRTASVDKILGKQRIYILGINTTPCLGRLKIFWICKCCSTSLNYS